MTVQEIEDRVRTFVIESFLSGPDAEMFRNNDDLFQVLDSLQVLRTVMQLETFFGVKVADNELTVANLGSIEKMAAFVAGKRQ